MKKLRYFSLSTVVVAMFLVSSVGVLQAGPCELPYFDPANFDSPSDNPYLPRTVIGSTYVYEAEDEDGLIRNYIQFSTAVTVIEGVTCTVVNDVEWIWVEDIGAWRKLEETEDWHAWDNAGNFWYLGEWTTEYEYDDGWNPTGSNNDGSWKADIGGGVFPGIILPAVPKQGDCYQQEYAVGEAEDVGRVLRLNASVSDYCDKDCMVMKESTPLGPGSIEHKYYAPGVGLVFIKELKGKTVEVELVDINNDPIPDPPDPIP